MTGARLDTGDADAYSGRFSSMREMSVSTGSTRTEKVGCTHCRGAERKGEARREPGEAFQVQRNGWKGYWSLVPKGPVQAEQFEPHSADERQPV